MNPSEILQEISNLSDDQIAWFLQALDYGVRDEWDCGLDTFFTLFWGPEFRIAAKTASYIAKTNA